MSHIGSDPTQFPCAKEYDNEEENYQKLPDANPIDAHACRTTVLT